MDDEDAPLALDRMPAFPSAEEIAALTRDNPKGRLFEFCQRTKCGRPKLTVTKQGEGHGVGMRLCVAGRALESGVQWARTRVLAEQLAARALLGALAASEDAGEADEELTPDDEARLVVDNPKGKLLARCVVQRLTPVFEVRPIVSGGGSCFEASAHVVLEDGREVWSAIRRGKYAKAVEQAVARSLLGALEDELTTDDVPEVGDDPRAVLNELRQKGHLSDYGFTLVGVDGPPHAPVFRMAGHAVRKTGERVTAAPIDAPSKKVGERLIALRLVRLLAVRV